MTDKFLKAKHWQLFILTFVIPMIFTLVSIVEIFIEFLLFVNMKKPTDMFIFMKFFPFITILLLGVLLGWLWSVVVGLQKKIPKEYQIKLTTFKLFFFLLIVYALLFVFYIGFDTSALESTLNRILLAINKPLRLFAMFCILHTLYFAAKTIKTAELKRPVKFSDFIGEFFLIWFFAIGIWIIQPKINKIVNE